MRVWVYKSQPHVDNAMLLTPNNPKTSLLVSEALSNTMIPDADICQDRVFKHQFIDSCIVPVLTQVLAVEPPNYATVLKLDKLVRDFQMPDAVTPATDGEQSAMCLAFQNYALHGYREMSARCVSDGTNP